jgi:hypothetical protein
VSAQLKKLVENAVCVGVLLLPEHAPDERLNCVDGVGYTIGPFDKQAPSSIETETPIPHALAINGITADAPNGVCVCD